MSVYLGMVILAYLLGSLASAILICKGLRLTDPRIQGSGNPGATNALRLHGRKVAALILAGDMLKGMPVILLLHHLQAADVYIAAAGLAAFTGHLLPLYFGFRGGKGVATLIGVLLATHWLLGLTFISIWLLVAMISRYSSLAAMTAAGLTPLFTWLLLANPIYVLSFALMSIALLWRHRSNITALLNGTESRIGQHSP